MALILSIETSASICSAALHESGTLVSHSQIVLEKPSGHAVTSLIKQVVANRKARLADIDAVAVSSGPGSYTGLRGGVSTAKGLCFALNKPLIALSTLRLLKAQAELCHAGDADYWYCPMLDARRMEVYFSLYDNLHNCILPPQPLILQKNSFEDVLVTQKVLFFGDGATKFSSLASENPSAVFIPSLHPNALHMGKIASDDYEEKKFASLPDLEPLYLKEFVPAQSAST